MPLIESALANGLERAYKDSSMSYEVDADAAIENAIFAQATAYHNYASMITAGPMIPIPSTMIKDSIIIALRESKGMKHGWTSALSAYWSPVLWADMPPAPIIHVPFNATSPVPILLFQSMTGELYTAHTNIQSKSLSTSEAADKISSILHTYTMKLNVLSLLITAAPPIPVPIPVM